LRKPLEVWALLTAVDDELAAALRPLKSRLLKQVKQLRADVAVGRAPEELDEDGADAIPNGTRRVRRSKHRKVVLLKGRNTAAPKHPPGIAKHPERIGRMNEDVTADDRVDSAVRSIFVHTRAHASDV